MSVNLIAAVTARRPAPILALLLMATCGLCATTLAAAASHDEEVPRVVVKYSDLNLSNPEDAATLLHRIEQAARRVCPDADLLNLRALQVSVQCRRQAVARAVGAIDSPTLNALLNRRTNVG
jgi:UrcA family protein